jgi:hypothetical protein
MARSCPTCLLTIARHGLIPPPFSLPSHQHVPLAIRGLYSDLLYTPWYCAQAPLKPQWLSHDNCPRVHCPTVEEFSWRFEEPNLPGKASDEKIHLG